MKKLSDFSGGGNASVSEEDVQDIVGAMLDNTSTVSAAYNDTTGKVQLTVIPGGLDKNNLGGSALQVNKGGTGADNAAAARTNLGIDTLLSGKLDASQKGAASGVAPLNSSSQIDSVYLPSYVDDVLEFNNLSSFPATGEMGKIYIAKDTNKQYRWSGSVYTELTSSPGTTDNVPEGPTNKYFTDARAQNALSTMLANKQDLLPTQTGNAGKFLGTNGSAMSWQPILQRLKSRVTNQTLDDIYSGEAILADSSSNEVNLYLQPPTANFDFFVGDVYGFAQTSNIKVYPPSGTAFEGMAVNEPVIINIKNGWILGFYNGNKYSIFAPGAGGGSSTNIAPKTASFTAQPNSINQIDHTAGGIIVGTLPETSAACTVEFTYATGTLNDTTSFLRVQAPATRVIDGNAAGDTEDYKDTNYTVRYSKAAGLSSPWYGAYQRSGVNVPGQTLGYTGGQAIPAGFIGEKLEAKVTTFTAVPASGAYGDAGSVPLTPGVWCLSLLVTYNLNSSTITQCYAGISTASGNNGAGLIEGDTAASCTPPISSSNNSVVIPEVYVNISSPQTYYAKIYNLYSAGTPRYVARLTAKRIA